MYAGAHPDLDTWVAVSRDGTNVVVHTAPCPNEQLTAISVAGGHPNEPEWSLRGSAPLPTEMVVGASIPGLATVVDRSGPLEAARIWTLEIETDLPRTWGTSVSFALADLDAGVWWTERGPVTDREAFLASRPAEAGCVPPYLPGWVLATLGGGIALALPGFSLATLADRPVGDAARGQIRRGWRTRG